MMSSILAAAAAGFTTTYVFLWALLHFTQDTREPPSIESAIPFLGPVIGMIVKGTKYHYYLRDKYNLPIYTLRLPGSRLYIINDTALIPVVQRQVRVLSLSPVMVRIFSHFMGVSLPALDIMGREPLEDHGFVEQITKESSRALAPGPNLDDLNGKAVQILTTSLGALCDKKAGTKTKLFAWVSREIMMATTTSVYGPRNPFKDPAVQAAYYKYEAGLITLLTGFMPWLLARQSLKARELLTEAFVKYYADGGLDEETSAYAQYRYDLPSRLGVAVRDVAKMEVGGSIGLVSNTMPATFWTIFHAFSDPVVLEDCRRELTKAVQEKDGVTFLDLAYVKSSCPIMLSTMQEALRFHSIGVSARVVMEDHLLGGRYLLKKGGTVMMPNSVQHTSALAWGENVDKFYHKRFVRESGGATTKTRTYDPVAFRAFGGGKTLCPGRHFASTEILAFASVILLRFDIQPVRGGQWQAAVFKPTNAAFQQPNEDIEVELVPRDNRKWHVFFSEPGKPMEISAEDIAAATTTLGAQGNFSRESNDDIMDTSRLRTVSLGWIGAVPLHDSCS